MRRSKLLITTIILTVFCLCFTSIAAVAATDVDIQKARVEAQTLAADDEIQKAEHFADIEKTEINIEKQDINEPSTVENESVPVPTETEPETTEPTTVEATTEEITTEPEPKVYEKGDVDMNGTVNMADVLTIGKHMAFIIKLSEESLEYADFNSDGDVGLKDILWIQKLIAYMIPKESEIIRIEYIYLNTSSMDLYLGQSKSVIASTLPSNTTFGLSWSTSNKNIATVSNGKITAIGEGECVITCFSTFENIKKSITVKTKGMVTGVSLDKKSLELKTGKTATLKATVSPSDAYMKTVKWKSSDSKVATVDSSGKITAVKAGTCTITCTTDDGGKTDTCKVTVKSSVTGVTLDKTSVKLKTGGTVTLKATVNPSDASVKTVKWKSSDSKIATVDSSGKVKAIKVGSCTITCTTDDGGKTATCKVTVKNTNTVCEVMGISRDKWFNLLAKEEKTNYYLGTAYKSGDWRSPNGDKSYNGSAGMNCTGFVWHTFVRAGAKKSMVPHMRSNLGNSYKGGWYKFIKDQNIETYDFATKSALLSSGKLKKGDIIWTWNDNVGKQNGAPDHHISIYWGDGSSDRVWHSFSGNEISKMKTTVSNGNVSYTIVKV